MDVQLRPIRESDHDRAAQIVFDAFGGIARQHNFPLDMPHLEIAQSMVKAFGTHPSVFAVAAEGDGKLLGVNFLDRRTGVGGVGPICVDPSTQQKGVGRKLMQAVIDDGKQRGLKSVRLVQDAFNTTSMSLYASLGFEVKEPLALMRGTPKGKLTASGATVRPVTENDLPACADLCRAAHGFDRSGELREAKELFRSMLLERSGRVVAYASAPTFWIMNHAVAERDKDLFDLLLGCGAAAGAEPLSMLIPIRRAALLRWCLSQGLRMVKPMTLMSTGEYQEPRTAFWPSVQF
ncbi:MAG: GNAT family N-acetyltransferase [Tepidisphaeraceae bacterium]